MDEDVSELLTSIRHELNDVEQQKVDSLATSLSIGWLVGSKKDNSHQLGTALKRAGHGTVVLDQVFSDILVEEQNYTTGMRFIIHPNSTRLMIWSMIISSIILYSGIVIPYRIGFDEDAVGSVFVLEILFDILFGIDIIINFNVALISEIDNRLIMNRGVIAKNYLKGWFAVDFLSSFPFDYVADVLLSADSNYIRSVKLIRSSKLFKIVR